MWPQTPVEGSPVITITDTAAQPFSPPTESRFAWEGPEPLHFQERLQDSKCEMSCSRRVHICGPLKTLHENKQTNLSSIPHLQHYLPLLPEEYHWQPPGCVLTTPHIQLADSYFKALLLFLQTSLLSKFECVLICEIDCIEYPLKKALCPQVYDSVCMWFLPSGSSKFLREHPALRLSRKIRRQTSATVVRGKMKKQQQCYRGRGYRLPRNGCFLQGLSAWMELETRREKWEREGRGERV